MGKEDINKNRIWEIDFLRGIALILMIYFHLIYDMGEIYGYPVDYTKGFNAFTGRAAGTLFIFLSGISSTLSRNNIKRGIKILALGLLITGATYLYNPQMVIVFGILHFLGTARLLSVPLDKVDVYPLAIGAIIIFTAGRFIGRIPVEGNGLFILGLTGSNFVSADYYPLIPWFGLFLFGVVIGKLIYGEKKSIFKFSPGNNPISFVGRRTLLIYLIHQPAIMLILEIFKRI